VSLSRRLVCTCDGCGEQLISDSIDTPNGWTKSFVNVSGADWKHWCPTCWASIMINERKKP